MKSFQIEFKQSVGKDLRKISPDLRDKIINKTEELTQFPKVSAIKKLQNTTTLYRKRVGEYRIIFQVLNDERKIIIYHIRHRKIAYKDL